MEPALSGLMLLRDDVLPVFDPASLVGSQSAAPATATVVIVLGLQGQPALGLLAEQVGKVVDLPRAVPLTTTTRLPAAFTGQSGLADGPRLLIVDAGSLAATMGLTKAVGACD
jgi:chemotaxis signal transduction protein